MTDLLAEFSRMIRAIPGLASFVDFYQERHQLARVAKDLAILAFWEDDGVIVPLKRIAAGEGSKEDIDELADRMRENAKSVTKAAQNIIKARANLSTKLGMEVAQSFLLS